MKGPVFAGSRKLDYAEKWLRDGLTLCRPPAIAQCLDVDMSQVKYLIQSARQRGIRLTYTHLLVKAAALSLVANPDLHSMVCANRIYWPQRVDIGLSIAGETFVAPVLVIEGADQKSLDEIAEEVSRRAPEIQASDRKTHARLRRWGWLIPSSVLRRAVLSLLFRFVSFRHQGTGTFQVSVLPNIDQAIAPAFSTSAMLVAGRVRDRVVAIDGMPVVRPIVSLTCCADHRVWDGRAGERFLQTLRQLLETAALEERRSTLDQGQPRHT